MIELKLKNTELITLISDEDFIELSRYSWGINNSNGKLYVKAKINCEFVMMHRLLMDVHGKKDIFVDHINGNSLDNQRENLRVCSHSQNMANRTKSRNSVSKFLGVEKRGHKWAARITSNGFRKRLGSYLLEEDAAKAYNDAAIKFHGEFANLNKI